jgi:hypothetical protein
MKTQRTRRERARRGRAPLPEAERKAKLIQTRVDDQLDEVLRDAAKERRVTVSQLIRNVLEDTFHLVDTVVADAAQMGANVRRDARRVAAAARGKPRDPAPAPPAADVGRLAAPRRVAIEDIEAWQEVRIGKQSSCERCLELLNRGDKALMGISDDPGAHKVWLCEKCATRL